MILAQTMSRPSASRSVSVTSPLVGGGLTMAAPAAVDVQTGKARTV